MSAGTPAAGGDESRGRITIGEVRELFSERVCDRPVIYRYSKYGREIVSVLLSTIDGLEQDICRLREGRFTEEEFQNLCHNFGDEDVVRFKRGCEEYQRKLFGGRAMHVGIDVDLNELAERVTKREGGAVQISEPQVKEVIRITMEELSRFPGSTALAIIEWYGENRRERRANTHGEELPDSTKSGT
jgi:hypothetical protein